MNQEPKVFNEMDGQELTTYQNFIKSQTEEPQVLKYDEKTDSFLFSDGGYIRRSIMEKLTGSGSPLKLEDLYL
jgi:hypothetical protein